MRHIHVRATVLLALFGGATLAYAYSTGPPKSETGAFAVATKPKETNCSLCHQPSAANSDPNGSLRLIGIPAQFVPGGMYPIQIQLNYNWSVDPQLTPVKWGFEIQAVSATSGDSAGTWLIGTPPDSFQIMRYPPLSTSTFKRRIYLEHTIYDYHMGENQDGQSGPIVWHATWVAPTSDSGKVYFFVAGNAANGDSCSICGGDHIYTYADSTVGGAPLDVPGPRPGTFITAFEPPYPNPMTQCIKLEFQIARAGMVNLAVYDLQGRRVRTLVHERLEPSEYGNFWNGRNDAGSQMRNGVYFIRLMAPGIRKPLSYRITLAR
jgi:hypothetical protein